MGVGRGHPLLTLEQLRISSEGNVLARWHHQCADLTALLALEQMRNGEEGRISQSTAYLGAIEEFQRGKGFLEHCLSCSD